MACLRRCIATIRPAFPLLVESSRPSAALSAVPTRVDAGRRHPSSQVRHFSVLETANALCGVADTALKWYGAATQQHAAKGHDLDDLKINIVEPTLGKKICPRGTHPLEYLSSLPGLKGMNLEEDVECSYFSQKAHSTVKIQCEADWAAFLNEGPPELQVRVTQRPLVPRHPLGQVRQWCQALINGWRGEESKMAECRKKLEKVGYRNLSSFGVIWVERGYKKGAWKEVVDTLVENGLPQQFRKPLVLAAEATKGSSKSLQSNLFDGGHRVLYHTKFRVMPGEKPGTVDGFIALYNFRASAPNCSETDMDTEEAFKTYVELDAKRRWQDEAGQLDLED